MPKCYMIFARKINKVPEFYTIFVRKCPNFTLCLPEKNFLDFFEGTTPCSPVSYANGWTPGPHQLNPALPIYHLLSMLILT